MQTPELPANEQERLKILGDLQLLDTLPEQDYDDIVELASAICHTPTALFTLVDSDRQWFKARVGFAAAQSGRDESFCGHAILGKDVFVVPDALKDDRFHDNPLVVDGPRIRAYAGAPITLDHEHYLGTLCVIDYQPREFSPEEQNQLRILARQVAHQLRLRMQARELARSNAELQHFSYAVSHDLQSPLNTIKGCAEVIAGMGPADEQVQGAVRFLSDSAQRMQETITDLLQHSRVGAEDRLTDSALDTLVQDALEDLSALIRDKNASVEVGTLPTLAVRPTEIRLLLQNLIGNAIKFVPAERSPQVDIQAEETRTGWQFRIADNGIGVDADSLTTIFEPGRRLNDSAQFPGNGLGLAHCQRIVKRHHGRIWMESEPGAGSQVYFTLCP